ncbi:hypothetical protein [Cnuella takakiae]|uniref:hypothetical protein n=1 Tax=Cnuella takakiae TaxID=1302690 RepID=UPI0011608D1A|nr:hypothetical protein [Cnuella takakiae]
MNPISQQLAALSASILANSKPELASLPKSAVVQINAPGLGGSFLPFSAGGLGHYPFYYENPNDLSFETNTYNWINSNLKNNLPPIRQDDGYFTNYFLQVFSCLTYYLSSADRQTLQNASAAAFNEQMELLQEWETVFGSIPAGGGQQPIDTVLAVICGTWAKPAIQPAALHKAANLQALLNQMPEKAASILQPLQNFLTAIDPVIPLINTTTRNSGLIKKVLAALKRPSLENGAVLASDQKLYPAYRVMPALPAQVAALNSDAQSIELDFLVSSMDNGQVQVSMQGANPFPMELQELFVIWKEGVGNLFTQILSLAGGSLKVEASFSGLSQVNIEPVVFDPVTGSNWYWIDPIVEAINNTGTNKTGFQFAPAPDVDFTEKGPFGYISALAISRVPTFRLFAPNSDLQPVILNPSLSGDVSLSFLNAMGGESANPYLLKSYTCPVANSSSTSPMYGGIELVPLQNDTLMGPGSVAWVHGVQTSFPASGN